MGRRLKDKIDNCCEDFTVFVTLTYPAIAPESGKVVKAHLRALVERARRVGLMEKQTWVWWMEFQERGAPHIHFISTGFVARRWIAKVWSEITSGNEVSCSRTEQLKRPEAAGSYAAKYAAKQEQKEVPASFLDVGRFWGVVGRMRAWAREGRQVMPRLSAVILRRSPGLAWATVKKAIQGLRGYETPTGWVIYAHEKLIRRAYRWLVNAKSYVTTTPSEGLLLQRMLDG